jgi:hypothetical protein
MAGRPQRKARLAREAAAASRRPVKPELKREALRLAEEHGPAEASSRTGVPASTIRMWRTRDKGARPAATQQSEAEAREVPPSPTARAENLRWKADRAREAQQRAEDRADRMLARGRASEARNASVVAAQRGDRARQLEDDARAEEAHRVALNEAQAELLAGVVRATFEAIELPVAGPMGELGADLLGQAGQGKSLAPPEPLAANAREIVRAAFRDRLRREIRAEVIEELREEAEQERQQDLALLHPSGEGAAVIDSTTGGLLARRAASRCSY